MSQATEKAAKSGRRKYAEAFGKQFIQKTQYFVDLTSDNKNPI